MPVAWHQHGAATPHPPPRPAELEELLVSVGRTIAKLHDGGLVHGDLTTSNMMLRGADRQLVGAGPGGGSSMHQCAWQATWHQPTHDAVAAAGWLVWHSCHVCRFALIAFTLSRCCCLPQVLIDFGLSYNSTIPEDKGVDLYVLERAFASAHAEEGAAMVRLGRLGKQGCVVRRVMHLPE